MTQETLEKKYYDMAKKEATRYLLVNQIIEQEKLELSDEDLEKALSEASGNSKSALEEIKRLYDENPDRFEMFKQTLLQKQAIQLIKDDNLVKVVAADPTGAEPADTEPADTVPAQS